MSNLAWMTFQWSWIFIIKYGCSSLSARTVFSGICEVAAFFYFHLGLIFSVTTHILRVFNHDIVIPFHAFFLKKLCLFLLLWFYAWNKCKHETADSDAITDWQPLPPRASIMCLQLYENFVEEVDAVDNGISQYDGEARYSISTTLSARVSHLNPRWNSTDQDTEVSTCECNCTLYQDRRWLLTCVWLRISYMGLIIVIIICLSCLDFHSKAHSFPA